MIDQRGSPAAEVGSAEHEIPYYDDLSYRDVFWAERGYEDGADRQALRALLPPHGGRLLEVGAGYGRLAREYAGYGQVVLLDPAETFVDAAGETFRADPRIHVVRGDAYALPFDDGTFDTVVCVRVVHHFDEPGAAFVEFARVLRPGGALVLEFANKRHALAMTRFALGRQAWSPYSMTPHEYRPMHFDRHPNEVTRLLRSAGLRVERVRTASLFRAPLLSRRVPGSLLLAVERPLGRLWGPVTPGPSVFLRARKA